MDWLAIITAILLVGTVAGIVIGWIDAFRDVVRDREDLPKQGSAYVDLSHTHNGRRHTFIAEKKALQKFLPERVGDIGRNERGRDS